MNYKMIATDLDGTLLYDVFTVSNENFKSIAEYKDMGGFVVPASGRCFLQIIPEIRECKDIKYCISSNGAVITDTSNGDRDEVLIPGDKFAKIMELTMGYETFHTVHFEGNGYMLAENDSIERSSYYNLNEYYYMHYHKWCAKLKSWDLDFFGGNDVEMVSVFFKSGQELDRCARELEALGGLIITSSADFNLEIVAKGASKGDGVRRLAKKLGISTDNIIGIGDSRNDIALLEAAGLPLAVSNAAEVLKAKASRVICSHKEHIIKYILEKIIE